MSSIVADANVKQSVPFFRVSDMAAAQAFYVDGLGARVARNWIGGPELKWCWLDLGGASVMLQQLPRSGADAWTPRGPLGEGLTVYFMCDDAVALYRSATQRGLALSRPVVSNGYWLTETADPDGYSLAFESATDDPEGSEFGG